MFFVGICILFGAWMLSDAIDNLAETLGRDE